MKKGIKKEKKINVRKYLLAISAGIFLVGTVFFAIEAGVSGAELAALEKTEFTLRDENRSLSDKIVEASSLSGVEKRASELGFDKPDNTVYIGTVETIAKLP